MNENIQSTAHDAASCTRCAGNAVIVPIKLEQLQQRLDDLLALNKEIVANRAKLARVVEALYNIPVGGMYRLETEHRVIVLKCEETYDIKRTE